MSFWEIFGFAYIAIGCINLVVFFWLTGTDYRKPSETVSQAVVVGLLWPLANIFQWYIWIVRYQHNYASYLRLTPSGQGYWIVLRSGACIPFGDAHSHISRSDEVVECNRVIWDTNACIQYDANGRVYVATNGIHHGDVHDRHATYKYRISDMIVTEDRTGYWMLDAGGMVFAFGTAQYHGDLADSARTLNVRRQWYPHIKGLRPARMFEERISMDEKQQPAMSGAIPSPVEM